MTVDWISVDWEVSKLRAWAMHGEKAVATVAINTGALTPDQFEPTLLNLIEPWLDTPKTIVACGTIGAKQGWHEAPFIPVPAKPIQPDKILTAPAQDPRLSVQIISGVSQTKPADVMRGEETQIAGLIAQNPAFDGVVCIPGTHTKWVRVSAEEIVNFQTFMTSEMFNLLSRQSVLNPSIDDGWDAAEFTDALSDTLSRPENFAAKVFSLHAESLLVDMPQTSASARLSGMLIGMELAAARQFWLGQHVAIIGSDDLATIYQTALSTQGLQAEVHDRETLTIAGLSAAYKALI